MRATVKRISASVTVSQLVRFKFYYIFFLLFRSVFNRTKSLNVVKSFAFIVTFLVSFFFCFAVQIEENFTLLLFWFVWKRLQYTGSKDTAFDRRYFPSNVAIKWIQAKRIINECYEYGMKYPKAMNSFAILPV